MLPKFDILTMCREILLYFVNVILEPHAIGIRNVERMRFPKSIFFCSSEHFKSHSEEVKFEQKMSKNCSIHEQYFAQLLLMSL